MSEYVTDEMVEAALEASYDPPKEPGRTFLNRDAYRSMWAHHMRAALEAVAPAIAAKALRDALEAALVSAKGHRDFVTKPGRDDCICGICDMCRPIEAANGATS